MDSDQTALKEQSDQDLHCLPFFLHLLEALLHCKIKLFYIKDNYGTGLGVPIFRVFTVYSCRHRITICSRVTILHLVFYKRKNCHSVFKMAAE